MLKTIIGTKVGMTQIFDKSGNVVPVTVISAGPCIISNIRTKEKNGYSALVLSYGDVKEKSLTKPFIGQFKKNNIPVKKYLREIRINDTSAYQVGQEIKAEIFQAGSYVDVSGRTKGKGFAGTVKRHGFSGGPSTHGQSDRQRSPGSIGSQGPQRVLKGMRMAGHLGNEIDTTQKLEIVAVDSSKNMILVKGAVPGVHGAILIVSETKKRVKVRYVAAAPAKTSGSGQKKKAAASAAPKAKK